MVGRVICTVPGCTECEKFGAIKMDGRELEHADIGLDLEKALGDIFVRLDRIEEKLGLKSKKYEIHVVVDHTNRNGVVRPFYVFGIFLDGRELKLAGFRMPAGTSPTRCMFAGIHEAYQYAYLAGAKQIALYINSTEIASAYNHPENPAFQDYHLLKDLWEELKQELGNILFDSKDQDEMNPIVVKEVKRIKTE